MTHPSGPSSRFPGLRALVAPGAAVFISSGCIMVLELAAGRLMARYLGSSLYTWTALIGIILAGIALGSYAGGRLADRFGSPKMAVLIFMGASALCSLTLVLNRLAGEWSWLRQLNWPLRIFIHTGAVFLLPAVFLGAVTPVIAKWALDRGLPAGKTLGSVYALSAAGSIAGTFAAGYILIPALHTSRIVWSVSAVMLAMTLVAALLFRKKADASKGTDTACKGDPAASFGMLTGPCTLVFLSNVCIMALELVAGRIISRYLGSSLYTWTSVIGVILAGITLGNYVGGRIADRSSSRRTLSLLFITASAACLAAVIAGNLVAEWTWLWQFSWPLRTLLHVSAVFLLPAVWLGTISPVVAKQALDRGLATGRTVGSIYAWGTAGCIAGTFLTGYILIAAIGTVPVIWSCAALLSILSVGCLGRFRPAWAWAALLTAALAAGFGPWPWSHRAGEALCLRTRPQPSILFENETQYNYIAVKRVSQHPEILDFLQDKLVHSRVNLNDLTDLRYSYEPIYAAVTHRFSRGKATLSTLNIGGGGYVFPRYIAAVWPGSRVDVVEIDPGVTRAAVQAFGLRPDAAIRTISLDGRNYIDDLLARQALNEKTILYDFIYEDAINDYSVPFQLTTREFNQKISRVLAPDGIYLLNLIDTYDSALFLGAVVTTLKRTFSHVYVLSEKTVGPSERCTFVIVAANRSLALDGVGSDYRTGLSVWQLSPPEMASLIEKSGKRVLTDDYAPVENLLAPVVQKNVAFALTLKKETRARRMADRMQQLAWDGRLPEALNKMQEILQLDPSRSARAYQVVAGITAERGDLDGAADVYEKGLAFHARRSPDTPVPGLHFDYAVLLQKRGDGSRAAEHLQRAEIGYRRELSHNPKSVDAHFHLGLIARQTGHIDPAITHFQSAIQMNPIVPQHHFYLIQTLKDSGRLDAAIHATQSAIETMRQFNKPETAEKLQRYLTKLLQAQARPGRGPT